MPIRSRSASKFQSIREWDGRQDRAFEELCFQLRDPTPEGVELIKTSAPDAGVEWYWRWPDGSEVGWQVKFIFGTADLLKAMRESLRSAALKRPDLKALTFCIPWDLADDPSRARGKQARERFEEAKQKWSEFAPNVEIELLSGGQLLERLAREEHRGREWFFFNERTLGKEWCAKELAYTIDDAGDRYTPKQDVELPVDRILEAVALPADFEAHLEERMRNVLRAGRALFERPHERWSEHLAKINGLLSELETEVLIDDLPPLLRTAAALELVEKSTNALGEFGEALHPVGWPGEPEGEKAEADSKKQTRERETAQAITVRARKVEEALWSLRSTLDGPACRAAESQALFVEGEAGQGKTHLFCDVAERLLAAGHPVVAILGERFRESSPWKRLAELLGDPGLGAAEIATVFAASGEASGRRAVLLIDALNESPEASIWATELADLRRRLTETGWVGFAVSCRSSYLDIVEPPGGPDTGFVHIEHHGYQGREFEAIERIFALHGVEQPRVPLLVPEFSNPLFLKLYCEGLKDEPEPPQGSEHLSAIFDRFANRRSKRVETKLNLDRGLKLVSKAIYAFANALGEAGDDHLDYEHASELINNFAPQLHNSPKTLLQVMASEGLLAIDRGWRADSEERAEMVSFPYQRFSDHLIVEAFLSSKLSTASRADAETAFSPQGRLAGWLEKAPQGLIEAFAVQLPERWEIEIADVLSFEPSDSDFRVRHRSRRVFEAFLSSVTLRDRGAFNSRTDALVNEGLRYFPEATIETLFSVAPDPDHPFNALRVHKFLSERSMPERDSSWTLLTYDSFGNADSALDRLIRWAAQGPYPWCGDKVIELAAIAITWTFASPNRFARDYATKALASLLIDRPDVHMKLIDRFAGIDDPYVTQRLAGALLGAITRAWPVRYDRKQASALLDALLSSLIEPEGIIPDLETRDYIASLARWLRRRKLIAPKLLGRATPPYGSRPPKIPRRAKYLEERYARGEDFFDGYGTLLSSALSSHSDWSRYVVSGVVDDFLSTRLDEPVTVLEPPASDSSVRINRKAWKRFEASLFPEQVAVLEGEDGQKELAETLNPNQWSLLRKAYVRRRKAYRKPMAYPPERASRFIFQRTVELGWTPERFGEFDRNVNRRSAYRSSHKRERFGKKYQWIARNELLARLADNFVLESWGGVVSYQGAWQLRARTLDPTVPPESIEIGDELETLRGTTFPMDHPPTWWAPDAPNFEETRPGSEGGWAELSEDLPTPEGLLRVVDPDARAWVIVDGHHDWREDPREAGSIAPSTAPYRDIAILSAGTFFRSADLKKLQTWLVDNPDLVRALPGWGAHGVYGALWAELPDESDLHDFPGRWHRPEDGRRLPMRTAPVHLEYASESGGFDCSISDSVNVELPSRFLVEEAGLEWRGPSNCWVDRQGREVMRYRETDEGFHRDRALMIEEDRLREFLLNSGLCLAVGLFCERRVFDELGGAMPQALGWVDYSAHLIFTGADWISSPMRAIDRHGGSVAEEDSP
jgi:hypothetical protein